MTRGRTRARVLRPGARGGRLLSLSGGRGPRTVVRGSMGCRLDRAQLRSSDGMRCLSVDMVVSKRTSRVWLYEPYTYQRARARGAPRAAQCKVHLSLSSPCVISRCCTRRCKTNLFGCARPVTRARGAPDLPQPIPYHTLQLATCMLRGENRACRGGGGLRK